MLVSELQYRARQLEQCPDTPQAMRLHSIYSYQLRTAARERKQWIVDSMVYNQLVRLAQTVDLHWNTILSYLVPDETTLIDLTTWYTVNSQSDELHPRSRLRAGRGTYWTGTYGNGQAKGIYLNTVYYMKVPEKTVTHYFPCLVDKRRPHLHTRSAWRGGGVDRYDDSEEEHDAVNILYWHCRVCCTTFTDERYKSLNSGISDHLMSPHHVHMRHRRRYSQLPWIWSVRKMLHDHRTFYDVGSVNEWFLSKGNGKGEKQGTRSSKSGEEIEIPKWFREGPCSEQQYHQGQWSRCSGWLYPTKDQWLRCDNIICDHHSRRQVDMRQVKQVTSWRCMMLRLLTLLRLLADAEDCNADEEINQQPMMIWEPPTGRIVVQTAGL